MIWVDFLGRKVKAEDITFNDTVLWSGSQTAYTQNFTLSDDALKYRELIVIVNTDDLQKAVYLPVIDGNIMSGSATRGYRWIDVNISSYTQSTKKLVLSTAIWTSSSSNSGTTITKIIGR